MSRSRFVAMMLFVSLAAWPSFAASKKTQQGTASERLLELASKHNTIDVIVGVALDEEWTPDGRLSPDKKNKQRAHIKEKKEKLLQRHPRAKRRANRDYTSIPFFVLEVDAHALRKLMEDESVTSIEENAEGEIFLAASTSIMGATAAHARNYRGNGQYVVIVDTGVDRDHSFFTGRVVGADEACFSGFDDDDSACPNGQDTEFGTGAGAPCPMVNDDVCDHGTHVAGIAAGRDHSTGYNGVAPDAWIIPIQVRSWRTCTTDHNCGGRINQADVVAALDYVNTTLLGRHPVAAVNMSLGFTPLQTSRAACDAAAPSFLAAVASLRSNDVAVVAGTGNTASIGQFAIPACLTGAIAVGATLDDDTVASYSNTATFLDFLAPGGAANTAGSMIWSSIPGGGYAEKSGTSMATPHVSGSFAILRQRSPLATVGQLQANLALSGIPITDTRITPAVVKPRIDVDAALDLADSTPPSDPGSFTASGSSSGAVTLTWVASTDNVAVDRYKLHRRSQYDLGWSHVGDVTGTSYTDSLVASKMYQYSIVAVDTSGLQSNTKYDYAVTVTFTDDPFSGVPEIVGRHVAELRQAVDAWREFANIGRIFSYTAPTGGLLASHFIGTTGVVNALNAARTQMSLPSFSYSTVPAPSIGGAMDREHIQQVRTAVR